MSRKRMRPREVRDTARALKKSLESTHEGIAALLESLVRSGFKDAVLPYQQMQSVLIQQRLWCHTYQREELNSQWEKIAETAQAIHAILAPFSTIMRVLKGIDSLESNEDAVAADVAASSSGKVDQKDPATVAFADLFLEDLSISNFEISRQLPWPEDFRKSCLRKLTEAGVLERRGWGRSLSYRLSPNSRRWLKGELITILERNHNPADKEA